MPSEAHQARAKYYSAERERIKRVNVKMAKLDQPTLEEQKAAGLVIREAREGELPPPIKGRKVPTGAGHHLDCISG